MSVYRVRGGAAEPPPDGQTREEWLRYLMLRREALILELRHVENVLVAEKRLRVYSLPKKPKY